MLNKLFGKRNKVLIKDNSKPDWDKLIKLCLVGTALVFLASIMIYSVTSYALKFNSDGATAGMIAVEQIKNHSLLVQGWYYSQDFWPFFVFNPVVILQPLLNNAFLATQIPVMIQTLLVFLLTIRLFNKISKNSLIYIIVAFIFSGVSTLWSDFFFGEGQYGTVLLWILLCLILIIEIVQAKSKAKARIFFWMLFVINFYINSTSIRYVPLFSGTAFVALLIVCFLFSNTIDRKRCAFLCLNLLISTGLGLLLFNWLEAHYVFFTGATSSNIVDYNTAITVNLPRAVEGFFSLICTGISGVSFASVKGIAFTYQFCVSLAVFLLPVASIVFYIRKHHKNGDFVKSFIITFSVLLACITIFSLLFTQLAANDTAAGRYMMVSVYISLFLIPILFEKFNLHWKYKTVILLLMLPIFILNAFSLNSGIFLKPQKELVAEYLENNGLSVGYATYWNADAFTILSNYKVKIYHIVEGQMKPQLFLSTPDFYLSNNEKNNFLMLTDTEAQSFDFGTIEKYMGQPIRVLAINNYKIYVYDKRFSDYLPDWASTIGSENK